MTTILKATISAINRYGITGILVPQGAKFLTVQIQYGEPVIWYMCDTQQPFVTRTIQVVGAGNEVSNPDELVYIATTQQYEGKIVNHFFERIAK